MYSDCTWVSQEIVCQPWWTQKEWEGKVIQEIAGDQCALSLRSINERDMMRPILGELRISYSQYLSRRPGNEAQPITAITPTNTKIARNQYFFLATRHFLCGDRRCLIYFQLPKYNLSVSYAGGLKTGTLVVEFLHEARINLRKQKVHLRKFIVQSMSMTHSWHPHYSGFRCLIEFWTAGVCPRRLIYSHISHQLTQCVHVQENWGTGQRGAIIKEGTRVFVDDTKVIRYNIS